jgi:ADP-ribosyl-[dinitrogen reductase] hydrolase
MNRMTDDVVDRARGALIGLAVGDALGAAVEFQPPGSFEPLTDMVGGGPHGLAVGEWTDDTSMALCLAESIIERRGFDPVDQLRRCLRWYREGYLSSTGTCFDIGSTTRHALESFERTGDPFAPEQPRASAANGSLMRLAPVPVAFRARPDVLRLCAASSCTTHNAPLPIDACIHLGGLIVGALDGVSRDELLLPGYVPRRRRRALEPEIEHVAAGSFKRKQPPEIRGSGYCVDALEAALWAFHSSADFRTGALLAVNLGDDADTTGAIYGQLAGAFYGESGIPGEWRERLAHPELLDRLADGIARFG